MEVQNATHIVFPTHHLNTLPTPSHLTYPVLTPYFHQLYNSHNDKNVGKSISHISSPLSAFNLLKKSTLLLLSHFSNDPVWPNMPPPFLNIVFLLKNHFDFDLVSLFFFKCLYELSFWMGNLTRLIKTREKTQMYLEEAFKGVDPIHWISSFKSENWYD